MRDTKKRFLRRATYSGEVQEYSPVPPSWTCTFYMDIGICRKKAKRGWSGGEALCQEHYEYLFGPLVETDYEKRLKHAMKYL